MKHEFRNYYPDPIACLEWIGGAYSHKNLNCDKSDKDQSGKLVFFGLRKRNKGVKKNFGNEPETSFY